MKPRSALAFATIVGFVGLSAIALRPRTIGGLSTPILLPGSSWSREWPKGTEPNFEPIENGFQRKGFLISVSDYVYGGCGNDYRTGPYAISISEQHRPDRTVLMVSRAWWPLW